MNDLASPARPWDTPREPRVRTLFAVEIPEDNPTTGEGWTSESY